MKGGVGKSTTTMMLADTLSLHHGERVLVVDCDPQANSSQMLLSFIGLKNAKEAGRTLTAWLESYVGKSTDGARVAQRRTAVSTLQTDVSGLSNLRPGLFHGPKSDGQVSVWASTPDLRFVEMAFDNAFFESGDLQKPRQAMTGFLSEAMSELSGMFGYVIFDCPPGFSTMAQAALLQSDIVVSPLNVDRVSMWSLRSFWKQGLDEMLHMEAHRHRYALLTMVQKGRGGQPEKAAVREDLAAFAGENRFDVEVPHTVEALRFVRRADVDSFRSFNSKYGRLREPIRRFGDEIATIAIKIHEERSNEQKRSVG